MKVCLNCGNTCKEKLCNTCGSDNILIINKKKNTFEIPISFKSLKLLHQKQSQYIKQFDLYFRLQRDDVEIIQRRKVLTDVLEYYKEEIKNIREKLNE